VDLAVALTTFVAILPAELPDKTFVATLVLSTRYRAWPVWLGVTAAFAVQTLVAVAAGGLAAALPRALVLSVTAVLFGVGALLLLLRPQEKELEEGEVIAESAPPTARRAALTSFAVLFAAEWGDLSQLLTAGLAARYDDPVSVFVGSWAALALIAALAVVGGQALLRMIPLAWVRRLAGVLFLVLAVVTGGEAVHAAL
jgi:Ca2+/H+ antiporter, TMEM165/GDT1 family